MNNFTIPIILVVIAVIAGIVVAGAFRSRPFPEPKAIHEYVACYLPDGIIEHNSDKDGSSNNSYMTTSGTYVYDNAGNRVGSYSRAIKCRIEILEIVQDD